MSGPAFTARRSLAEDPSSAHVFYALREASGDAVDRRLAYLPAAAATSPDMSLTETWTTGGVYVFLGRAANNDISFLRAFQAWRKTKAPKDLRLLWVEDPDAAPDLWKTTCVRVNRATDQGGTLAVAARMAVGNYAAVFKAGCTLALDADKPGFVLAAPATAPQQACFSAQRGAARVPASPAYALTASGAELSLRGPAAGALAFGLDIAPPSRAEEPTCFDTLDVGCRYFYPSHHADNDPFATLRFPIFDGRAGSIALAVVLDPAAPEGDRSEFSFPPSDVPLATFFRSVYGGRIGLKPLANAALRLEPYPNPTRDPSRDSFYLVPAGDFEVALPEAAAGAEQLLCGICAAEYLALTAGTVLTFVPGQPAFAPLFDPAGASTDDEAQAAPRLDFDARTAWMSVAAAVYYAQPAGAVFYGRSSAGPAPEGSTLLPFFPVPTAELPAQSGQDAADTAFPLVPYAGIDALDADTATALETEVLSQERRELIHELNRSDAPAPAPEPLADDAALTAVTPVGLVARFNTDKTHWESLTLARMNEQRLALQNVAGPLRAALLTNQQFLVISDPEALAAYFGEHSRIAIRGWEFDLDPGSGKWDRHGTILLIKNCEQSVARLADDVGTWALADTFNRSPEQTQAALQDIIATARRDNATDAGQEQANASSYGHFVKSVIDDPNWNGVLFLNCFVPPAALPADLRDLAAGLDAQRLYAHHMGINQTAVTGPDLGSANSSMFGLIHYADELRPPGSSSADYDFQVLKIEVLFANSEIQHFSSSVAVTLMRLFGAGATAPRSSTGNALILEGAYQRRGDRSAYVYRNQGQVVFELDDAVLKRVKLQQAEFGSAPQDSAANGGDAADSMAVAQFTFRGALAFGTLPEASGEGSFDLFSYDELSFSKLALEMRYSTVKPQSRSFRLDSSGVSFSGGTARPGSMARHFPVQPVGMISDADTAEPSGLGFMNVSVPSLAAARLDSDWFGLVFDLDLGTPGALAGAVGFTARLALVWSPAQSTAPVFVGLKMPGSSGTANELSLMGVLKLTIKQLQLLHSGREFILKLTGMTLKVMGKTLPPGATFDFFLFGDSAAAGGVTSLGWYGAYKRPPDPAADCSDDDKSSGGLRRGTVPAASERRPWSRALLLEALRDPPQE